MKRITIILLIILFIPFITYAETCAEQHGLRAMGLIVDGPTNIIEGEIKGSYIGIDVKSNSTLTLGTNDGNINTNSPIAYGIGYNGIGIQIGTDGTVNYYDGIIKATRTIDLIIDGTITNIPTGYTINKETVDGVHVASLVLE